ncbi:MAG: hypothetical protein Q9159_001055 [Coniocarpon cinnabarinum]
MDFNRQLKTVLRFRKLRTKRQLPNEILLNIIKVLLDDAHNEIQVIADEALNDHRTSLYRIISRIVQRESLEEEILDTIIEHALVSALQQTVKNTADYAHRQTALALAQVFPTCRGQIRKVVWDQHQEVRDLESRALFRVQLQCRACSHKKRESAKACTPCNEKVEYWRRISALEFSAWRTATMVSKIEPMPACCTMVRRTVGKTTSDLSPTLKSRNTEYDNHMVTRSKQKVKSVENPFQNRTRSSMSTRLVGLEHAMAEILTSLELKEIEEPEAGSETVVTAIDGERVWIRRWR